MSNDASEILVAGTGQLYVAPYSATLTLPTTIFASDPGDGLAASFVNVGYTTEDGVVLSVGRESQTVPAWQSTRPVRRFNSSQMETFTATLLQWNEDTLALAFGGGSVSHSGDTYRYDFPAAGAVDERAIVVDWVDGDKDYRLVIPRTIITETTETTLARTAPSTLPITFESFATAPYILTDDDNFSPVS